MSASIANTAERLIPPIQRNLMKPPQTPPRHIVVQHRWYLYWTMTTQARDVAKEGGQYELGWVQHYSSVTVMLERLCWFVLLEQSIQTQQMLWSRSPMGEVTSIRTLYRRMAATRRHNIVFYCPSHVCWHTIIRSSRQHWEHRSRLPYLVVSDI